MRSKKSILWSTLVGAVIIAVVFIYVVLPVLGAIYRVLFPPIDFATLEGYERLAYWIENINKFPSGIIIPVTVNTGYQIAANKAGCPEGCLCLCKPDENPKLGEWISGCLFKTYRQVCVKDYEIKFENLHLASSGNPETALVRIFGSETLGVASFTHITGPLREEYGGECSGQKYRIFYMYDLNEELLCVKCSDNTVTAYGKTFSLNPPKDCGGYSQRFCINPNKEEEAILYLNRLNIALSYSAELHSLFKQQCENDPCNVGLKGKCRWEESNGACMPK